MYNNQVVFLTMMGANYNVLLTLAEVTVSPFQIHDSPETFTYRANENERFHKDD